MSRGKLTPQQRRTIFMRWIEGNRQWTEEGIVPETMEQIGADYGVSAAAVNWIIRNFSGDANRRKKSRKPVKCLEPDCKKRAESKGRCRKHYEKWKWDNDPDYKARTLAKQAAYRDRRRELRNSDNAPDCQIAQPAAEPRRDRVADLAALLRDLDVPVRIGLTQQGHMATVEAMLAEGASWDEIGAAIGWHGPTAAQWYAIESQGDPANNYATGG